MENKNINKELVLFDCFAGIGAIYKAIKKIGMSAKLIGSSEIDPYAIMSYAAMHNLDTDSVIIPIEKEIKNYLIKRNIGYDFKKGKSTIQNWRGDKLKRLYQSCIAMKNYGDVSLINPNKLPYFDLFNFSFPCQSLSVAGKQEGMIDKNGNLTRSGLYTYGINIIKTKKPKYIMIENVKNLISKKFIDDFYSIINELESIGYNCYYPKKKDKKDNTSPTCLNAKDYGVPQNRERIFVICIRKDIDTYDFEFPIGKDYGIRLKDILEDEVDEKYYLSEEYLQRFKASLDNEKLQHKIPKTGVYEVIGTTVNPQAEGTNSRHWVYNTDKIISTIDATTYKQPKQIIEIGKLNENRHSSVQNSILSKEGISPTLDSGQGGYRQPKILENSNNNLNQLGYVGESNSQGNRVYDPKGIATTLVGNAGGLGAKTGLHLENDDYRILAMRGRYKENRCAEQQLEIRKDNNTNTITTVQKDNLVLESDSPVPKLIGGIGEINFGKQFRQGNRVYSSDKTAMCLLSQPVGNAGGFSYLYKTDNYRIRKLTPLECLRLMGFDDEDYYKIKEIGISDTRVYQLAGNSIVVNVLTAIFKNLFKIN